MVGAARFVLAHSLAPFTAELDEAIAASELLSRQTNAGESDFASAVRTEANRISAERENQNQRGTILVLVAQGGVGISEPPETPYIEAEGYIVGTAFVDKKSIAERYYDAIASMKAAIGITFPQLIRFENLLDDLYMTHEGKTLYSRSRLRGPAWVTHAGYDHKGSAAKAIAANFQLVYDAADLKRVSKLYLQMATSKKDLVRAYLLGWTAFEILLAKSFSAYEAEFFSSAGDGWHPTLRTNFISSVREVLDSRYRADHRISAVTAVLFADLPDKEISELIVSLKRMKKLRDEISHGQDFEERLLPIKELDCLLRRYFVAVLQRGARSGAWPFARPR
jgi:hypothetical protein